jgi:hypothetical protein
MMDGIKIPLLHCSETEKHMHNNAKLSIIPIAISFSIHPPLYNRRKYETPMTSDNRTTEITRASLPEHLESYMLAQLA